jgi:DNA-directed RNA polymerase specialized sigma24 family protein
MMTSTISRIPCMTSTPPRKWSLSRDAFEQLLERLGPDREAASQEYEAIRRRLIHFFDWRGSLSPDVEADTTLDRVARKLQEGEVVDNVNGYVRGVARYVLQESQTRSRKELAAVDEMSRRHSAPAPPDPGAPSMGCLSRCLAALPEPGRALIVAYYRGDGRVHLTERKALAEQLGLTYAVLKKRAHRQRELLHKCVVRCLEGQKAGDQ